MYKLILFFLLLSIGVSQTELSIKYRNQFLEKISEYEHKYHEDYESFVNLSKKVLKNNFAEGDSLLRLVCEDFIARTNYYKSAYKSSPFKIPEIYNSIKKIQKYTDIIEYELIVKLSLREREDLNQLLSLKKELQNANSYESYIMYLENETQIAAYYRKYESDPLKAMKVIDQALLEINKLNKEKLDIKNFAKFRLNLALLDAIDLLAAKAMYIKYAIQNQFGLQGIDISSFEKFEKSSKTTQRKKRLLSSIINNVKADYYLNKGDFRNGTFFYQLAINSIEEIYQLERELAKKVGATEVYFSDMNKRLYSSIHFDYFNLAFAQIKFGAYGEAIKNLQICYDYRKTIFDFNHEKIAVSEIWLGHAYSLNGEYKKAQYYFNKGNNSLALKNHINIDDYAELEFFRGQMEYKLADYKTAKQSFLKALELNLEYVGQEHEYTADNYRYLGLTEERLGNHTDANRYFNRAIRSLTFDIDDFNLTQMNTPKSVNVRKPVQYLKTISNLADNYAFLKNVNELEKTANIGIDFLKSIEKNYYNESSKYTLNSIASNLYEHKLNLYSKQFEESSKISVLREMIILIDDAKSGNLQREIILRDAISESNSFDKWNEIRQLENVIIQKENRSELVDNLKSEHIKLVNQLTSNFKVQYKELDLIAVNEEIEEDELLLDYFVTGHFVHLITLKKNKLDQYPIIEYYKIKNSESNAALANHYITSIRKQEQGDFKRYQSKISELLLSQIKDELNTAKRLTILPHSFISTIPFSTLKVDNEFLIESKSISNHYALSLLTKRKKVSKNKISFSAFAPVFDDGTTKISDYDRSFEENHDIYRSSNYQSILSDRGVLSSLKESYNEVVEIAELFNKKNLSSHIYAYEEANESNFKKASKYSNILHISSHSFYNEIDYNKSAIVFSSPKTNREDGFLFSNESYLLDLNTELLVLSSCESGKGKLVANEGMMSLSRGFYYSGAKNILSSLWKVSDKKTKLMMVSFYKHLLNDNISYSEALQKAQLEMLQNPETASAKYWSAFMLIGR